MPLLQAFFGNFRSPLKVILYGGFMEVRSNASNGPAQEDPLRAGCSLFERLENQKLLLEKMMLNFKAGIIIGWVIVHQAATILELYA